MLDVIKAQELYEEYYLPAIETVKKTVMYGFYARATLPWKLSCEAEGVSRTEVLNLFMGDDLSIDPAGQVHTSNLLWNVIFAGVLLGITVMFCCFGI